MKKEVREAEGWGQASVGSGSDQMAGAGEQVNRCTGLKDTLLSPPYPSPPSLGSPPLPRPG